MRRYDAGSAADMAELALDMVTTTQSQRACAVVHAMASGIVETPRFLRFPFAAAVARHGMPKGCSVLATYLSRNPEVLLPLWDEFSRALGRGGPAGDGRRSARLDQEGLEALVEMMGRVGWTPPCGSPPGPR